MTLPTFPPPPPPLLISDKSLIVAHFAQSYSYPISNYGVQIINESAGNQIKYVNQHA